jgi:hypothetical protein
MAYNKPQQRGSQLVGHRDFAARLRAEFPQSKINVSRVTQGQRGEFTLTVAGANVRTVYMRARVLACIAVLYNCAAFYNRQLSKSRWTRFAALCGQSSNNQLQFRRGRETVSFYLEPVGSKTAGDSLSLYLREL